MWNEERSGEWGDCDLDRDIEDIVSPYEFTTAAAHYAGLLAEARANGGPTQPARESLPRWDGWYTRGARDEQWLYGRNLQTATMISLLTPEYRERMTQMNFHEAVNNAPQWNASFCYPEGLMRWWSEFAIRDIEVLVTPYQVQFVTGVADNFLRKVLIGASTRSWCRNGMARRSASGMTTRWWRGRPTSRAGHYRTPCSSTAARSRSSRSSGQANR